MTEKAPSLQRIFGDDAPRFELPIYQGPLDLLLHLIKRAELDPRDVTASIITEQYLTHLELMQQLNLDLAGEYLVMASTLLLIKSFALLPQPQSDTEEIEDLRRDLVERLLEYQRYREAAAKLGEREVLGRDVFSAPGEKPAAPDEATPPFRVSLFDLVQAMAAILQRHLDRTPRRIELRDIPVARCIPSILSAIAGEAKLEFSALFATLDDRSLVIASFLALLELIRRGAVRVWQEDRSGPIYLGRGERFGAPDSAGPNTDPETLAEHDANSTSDNEKSHDEKADDEKADDEKSGV